MSKNHVISSTPNEIVAMVMMVMVIVLDDLVDENEQLI